MRAQASPEGTGGVPRALAVMGDEAAVIWRTLPANRPPYRVDRDLLGDAPGHRPAHDLAGEGTCHGCESMSWRTGLEIPLTSENASSSLGFSYST